MPLISKAFSNLITFSRTGGAATYFAANGVLTTAANNEPRFDYDPATFLPRGLLIEEQRTNSIRNNTMQGAVAGTPGTLPTNWVSSTTAGVSVNVVGTGTESGITYIDVQFVGTPLASGQALVAFDGFANMTATPAATYTGSLYIRRSAGSNTNVSSIINQVVTRDSGGVNIGNQAVDITSTVGAANIRTNRPTNTFTAPALTAFIQHDVRIGVTNGLAIDITLRIGLPQLEQGAFATSVIPTTTTALTRNADVASVNTLSPWFNSAAGSWYVETISPPYFGAGYYPTNVQFTDGTSNNTMATMFNTNGAPRAERTASGVVAGSLNTAPVATINTLTKQAFAYALNDFALVANGGTPATSAAGNVPTGLTQMTIGALFTGNKPNSYLRRITYYPTRLSNAQLQTITT